MQSLPNEHGVYTICEVIEIPIARRTLAKKYRLVIRLAQDEIDGLWRWGHGYDIKGVAGGGHAPHQGGSEYEFKSEAILSAAGSLHKHIRHDADPAVLADIVRFMESLPPDTPPAPQKIHHRPRIGYLVGWADEYCYRTLYADGITYGWGMTPVIQDAYRFDTLDDAIAFYRSRHTWPDDYEKNIWDGTVHFYQETKKGIQRVMPRRPQGELFA